MAYDRYDTRRGREDSRPTFSGERGGRRDERGFFERAGDEISSWFSDDDDDRGRRGRGERERERERERNWAPEHGWGGNPDRGRRDEWRGQDRQPFDEDRQRFDEDRQRGDFMREGSYRPLAGDYGRSERDNLESSRGREDFRRPAMSGSSSNRMYDRHYNEWRQRQLDELDRDYDEYHRERQQHFENDFGSWRQARQSKRQLLSQAREHMEVVGSDGEPVGKVDRVAGDRLILGKTDSPDGRHHSIPCTMIDRIEGDRVLLDCTAEQAQKRWRDDDRERALFERDEQGEAGPQMLDRSFSGTYRD
jgi:hypothetical protein